jgi:hypothetical protein
VLLEVREAGELVADFDYTVFIGLEEEADIAVIDDGRIQVRYGF